MAKPIKYGMYFVILILCGLVLSGCGISKDVSKKGVNDLELEKKFYNAILKNDYNTVDKCIEEGVNVTKLHLASVNGTHTNTVAIALLEAQNTNMATYLIKKGADVNDVFFAGASILMYVTISNLPGTVKIMIDGGADIEYHDRFNKRTALDFAMRDLYYENEAIYMLNVFVDGGAKVDTMTFLSSMNSRSFIESKISHYNELEYASSHYKKIQLICNLLSKKDIKYIPKALYYAIKGDTDNMLQHLSSTEDKYYPLITYFTAAFGKVEGIKELMKKDKQYKIKDRQGNNLAVIAATYNNMDMLKYLISIGVDPTMENRDSDRQRMIFNNALILAIRNQSYDSVEYLIDNKYLFPSNSIISDKQWYYSAELEELAYNYDIKMLNLLIAKGFVLGADDYTTLEMSLSDATANTLRYDLQKEMLDYLATLKGNKKN